MDGTPTLRMNEFVLASLAFHKVDLGPSIISDPSSLPPITELTFDTDSKIISLIEQSAKRFDNLVDAHDLHVLHYEGFGKDFTKKHKVSPDATVQLIKQLAFHKFMGRPSVTYESAQTRKFQLGRTEVIRSASNESQAWVEAMLDPAMTVGTSASFIRFWPNCSMSRTRCTSDHYLYGRLLDTSNTLHGLQTDKEWTDTFSG
jgi:carnitine O-acetyltransferase